MIRLPIFLLPFVLVAAEPAPEPVAIAADNLNVFLGWNAAISGDSIVALGLDDRPHWRWRHPVHDGVRDLAVDGGFVFVQTMGPEGAGALLVRLNALDGKPAPFVERESHELAVSSLWPADADIKPDHADAMTAHAGRIYLSFTAPGFIAVLDAKSGAYVTTLSGPQVGPMALSSTPMHDPGGSGKNIDADFGVVTIAQKAVSYFVMPHDPPWVAANTTHRLGDDDHITALLIRGDTMKTGDVSLFLGLGAPQHQVQSRPASNSEGFTWAAGVAGGGGGPGALGDIRSLAIDARGRLWIAEGGAVPRFSVWSTDGSEGRLLGEVRGAVGAERLEVAR